MGITPQTQANGLYPYGMLYDLITNDNVPIVWCINSAKAKDGADFTYNAVNYSGGTFIVPAQFITPAVAAKIASWQALGVQGAYTTGALSVPVYDTLTCFPKIMIDNDGGNQGILANYYTNASIPSSAYSVGTPSGLGTCYDVWTAPHSDPTWATHSYLYNFVTVNKGWVWAQCHSPSVLESCQNPSFPFNSLHFLTTAGMQCFQAGACNGIGTVHAGNPTAPYTYYYPADPVMQFMGLLDPATQNGSEKWYIPLTAGQWYAGTKRAITTSNGASPKEGVLLVYGNAFGNASNGMVMYEAGHSLTGAGSAANQVAAQRAYFNFILAAGIKTRLNISATVPSGVTSGGSYAVSSSVSTGSAPYTYSWSSRLGGSFANASAASTTYTAPVVASATIDILTIKVTDNCGRVNIKLVCVPVAAAPLPIELLKFSAMSVGSEVQTEWTTASEINNDYFTVERSIDAFSFEPVGNLRGAGNSSELLNYKLIDEHPMKGLSYYRLKQTDYDGNSSYSEMVPVQFKSKGFVIYPNPAHSKIYILPDDGNDDAELVLADISGKSVLRKELFFTTGDESAMEIDLSNIPAGVYLVTLSSGHKSDHFKLTVY